MYDRLTQLKENWFDINGNPLDVYYDSPMMCTGKSGHEILLNGESKHGKKTL